nr:UBN2 domain-containing protein [Tanacetum cinerariifolium]
MVVEWVACLKSDVSSRVFGDEDKRRLCGRTGCVKRKKRSGSVSSKVKGSMKLVLDIFHTVMVCECVFQILALDEGYSSNNYVRKFLRAQHPKWRANVTVIEYSKDLTSLSLDELIRNLIVHELIIKKHFEIVKAKGEKRHLALKDKKESSDEESLTSGSEDEEHAMAVRDFRKFFKRRGSEEDDEKAKDETCLMAQASSGVHFESSYFSDENSSIDDITLDSEYNKLCKIS